MIRANSVRRAALRALVVVILLATSVPTVSGQPIPPMLPWGRAYINGQPAEDGIVVQAAIGGSFVASGTTYTQSGQKGWYALMVPGLTGDAVDLFVDGAKAVESPKSWKMGTYHLDLHAIRAHLVVTITPVPDINVGMAFTVSATVQNVGQVQAAAVKATIGIAGGAVLEPGQTLTKAVGTGTLNPGQSAVVTWALSCASGGPVTVTVTPSGIDTRTLVAIPARYLQVGSATVRQEVPSYLVAHIASPSSGEVFSMGQAFVLTAVLSNTGGADALHVSAVLGIEGGAELAAGEVSTHTLARVAGGSSGAVSWTLVCTSTEAVTLTVAPAGTDENTGAPIPGTDLEGDSVTVEQELPPFLVVQAAAPDVAYVDHTFGVSAMVQNTGEASAMPVTLTLAITGPASLAVGEVAAKGIPALHGGSTSEPVTWMVRCQGPDDVTLRVMPAGVDEHTGQAIAADRLVPVETVVHQVVRLYLPVLLHAP